MSVRNERLVSILKNATSVFIQQFSEPGTIATVTNLNLSENAKNATIFFTVLPEKNEVEILKNFKKKIPEFRYLLIKKYKINSPPELDLKIDVGEKNRQKIDALMAGQ